MENNVNELIYKLLKLNTCTANETNVFHNLKHNDDLVPKFRTNFEKLSQIIGSYYNDCYDIQGVTDDGVDVLLKYKNEDENHKVGFQIKSYDDIKKKDWLSKLKAQLYEAQGIWKTDDLYVVLCTDVIEHKDKLRIARSEIQKKSDCDIHIVEPENALTFYKFTSVDIFSTIYDFYHKSDSRLKRTRDSLKNLSTEEKEILISVIVRQFLGNEKPVSLSDIDCITENMDICYFSDSSLYEFDNDTYSLSFSYENNWDLTCFIAEIKASFDLRDSQIETFLKKLLL